MAAIYNCSNPIKTLGKFGGNENITYLCRKKLEFILEENKELAIEKWNDYFGNNVSDENY